MLWFDTLTKQKVKELMITRNECCADLLDDRKITLADAKQFYRTQVLPGNELIYLAMYDNYCIGYFNAKKYSEPDVYECGYKIKKQFRGKGCATKLLGSFCKLMATNHNAKGLICEIKTTNIPSIKVCTNNGFTLSSEKTVNGLTVYIYSKNLEELGT
jgi:RimJ/RimL family protein N-acetyltransferase